MSFQWNPMAPGYTPPASATPSQSQASYPSTTQAQQMPRSNENGHEMGQDQRGNGAVAGNPQMMNQWTINQANYQTSQVYPVQYPAAVQQQTYSQPYPMPTNPAAYGNMSYQAYQQLQTNGTLWMPPQSMAQSQMAQYLPPQTTASVHMPVQSSVEYTPQPASYYPMMQPQPSMQDNLPYQQMPQQNSANYQETITFTAPAMYQQYYPQTVPNQEMTMQLQAVPEMMAVPVGEIDSLRAKLAELEAKNEELTRKFTLLQTPVGNAAPAPQQNNHQENGVVTRNGTQDTQNVGHTENAPIASETSNIMKNKVSTTVLVANGFPEADNNSDQNEPIVDEQNATSDVVGETDDLALLMETEETECDDDDVENASQTSGSADDGSVTAVEIDEIPAMEQFLVSENVTSNMTAGTVTDQSANNNNQLVTRLAGIECPNATNGWIQVKSLNQKPKRGIKMTNGNGNLPAAKNQSSSTSISARSENSDPPVSSSIGMVLVYAPTHPESSSNSAEQTSAQEKSCQPVKQAPKKLTNREKKQRKRERKNEEARKEAEEMSLLDEAVKKAEQGKLVADLFKIDITNYMCDQEKKRNGWKPEDDKGELTSFQKQVVLYIQKLVKPNIVNDTAVAFLAASLSQFPGEQLDALFIKLKIVDEHCVSSICDDIFTIHSLLVRYPSLNRYEILSQYVDSISGVGTVQFLTDIETVESDDPEIDVECFRKYMARRRRCLTSNTISEEDIKEMHELECQFLWTTKHVDICDVCTNQDWYMFRIKQITEDLGPSKHNQRAVKYYNFLKEICSDILSLDTIIIGILTTNSSTSGSVAYNQVDECFEKKYFGMVFGYDPSK